MPRTIREAFELLTERLRTPPQETANQAGHRISIEACLRAKLGMTAFFMSGSFGNGTNIPGHSDVDRFAVLPADQWAQNSRVTLVAVKNALNGRFKTTIITMDPPGVRIDFRDSEEVNEIIPVFEISRVGSSRVFIMPSHGLQLGGAGWMNSAPEAHKNYVEVLDERWNGRLKPLIRLLKAWKYYNRINAVRSFYLEMFASSFVDRLPHSLGGIDYAVYLRAIFNELRAHQFPEINDPIQVAASFKATTYEGQRTAVGHASCRSLTPLANRAAVASASGREQQRRSASGTQCSTVNSPNMEPDRDQPSPIPALRREAMRLWEDAEHTEVQHFIAAK